MSEEAEKVINLSLCKMAESRTIRRGGSSLHKHLLISSVLTKARSAWETLVLDMGTDRLTPLQAAAIGEDPESTDFQTELELLHCVERLGGFTERELRENLLDEVDAATADMILSGERESESPSPFLSQLGQEESDVEKPEASHWTGSKSLERSSILGDLFGCLKQKRGRSWSHDLLDEDEDEDDDRPDTVPDRLRLGNTPKRLRFSTLEPTVTFQSIQPTSNFQVESTALDPFFMSFTSKGSSFRTKKAHFDVEEEESEETQDLLEDDDDWCTPREAKNDRRVPSSNGSSSSSSSDEEVDLGVSAMEVDKLTTLVQYFSFKSPPGVKSPPAAGSLVRSMSTPDLCSRSSNGNCVKGPTDAPPPSPTNAQDLFTSFNPAHHHFVSMKV